MGENSVAGPTPKCPGASLSVTHTFEDPFVSDCRIPAGISNATNTVILLLIVESDPPVPTALTVIV